MYKIVCDYLLFIMIACGLTACKKNSSDFYTGNFYIRAPLIENNYTYMIPAVYYDGLNIINNAALKKFWKFIPISNNEYNIALTDSNSLLITADSNGARLATKSTDLADNQKFRIVPSVNNPFRVAFQSPVTGKFIQLDYCYKNNETWGYLTPMDDSSACGYQKINLYNQADTCYCLYQFVLERN
jgi:hypothetical protein